MSHELRTPLNAVLGFSELMAQDSNLTTDQRENLAIIGRSGEHLLALINDVLDLSKIEAGRTDLQPEVFDLHEMLLGLDEMFSLRAEHKKLTVIFDLAPGVPRAIRTDAGKLRQILAPTKSLKSLRLLCKPRAEDNRTRAPALVSLSAVNTCD